MGTMAWPVLRSTRASDKDGWGLVAGESSQGAIVIGSCSIRGQALVLLVNPMHRQSFMSWAYHRDGGGGGRVREYLVLTRGEHPGGLLVSNSLKELAFHGSKPCHRTTTLAHVIRLLHRLDPLGLTSVDGFFKGFL